SPIGPPATSALPPERRSLPPTHTVDRHPPHPRPAMRLCSSPRPVQLPSTTLRTFRHGGCPSKPAILRRSLPSLPRYRNHSPDPVRRPRIWRPTVSLPTVASPLRRDNHPDPPLRPLSKLPQSSV